MIRLFVYIFFALCCPCASAAEGGSVTQKVAKGKKRGQSLPPRCGEASKKKRKEAKCSLCGASECHLEEVEELPTYVSTFVRHEEEKVGKYVCLACLTQRGELNFRPAHGPRSRCASNSYGCTKPVNRSIPTEVDRVALAKPPWNVPLYAPQRSLCNSCFGKISRAKNASVRSSSAPSQNASEKCDCYVVQKVRANWYETSFREAVCRVISDNVNRFMACLGFPNNSAEYRAAARLAKGTPVRKTRSDAFSQQRIGDETIEEIIVRFWEEESHPCPTGKKVVRFINGERVEKDATFVLYTFAELHEQFVKRYRDIPRLAKVGVSKFKSLRPFWVRSCPDSPRTRCRQHTEFLNMVTALKRWRSRFHATCPGCQKFELPENLKDLNYEHVRVIVNCIHDSLECSDSESDADSELEESDDELEEEGIDDEDSADEGNSGCVPDDVSIVSDKGARGSTKYTITYLALIRETVGSQQRLVAKRTNIPVSAFTTLFLSKMKEYKEHHELALNQPVALKELLEGLPEDEAVVFIDFSAKFELTSFECLQEDLFGKTKTSILVCVVATRDRKKGVTYESHFFISANTKQNALWTITALNKLVSTIVPNTRLHFFFDNGPHFANNQLLNWLTCQKFRHIVNYWASNHGKGLWDNEGWQLKRAINKANKSCKTVEMSVCNAKEVYHWAKKNFTPKKRSGQKVMKRSFHFLDALLSDEEMRPFSKWAYAGMLKFSCFQTVDESSLQGRARTCYCSDCQRGAWENCAHDVLTHTFTPKPLGKHAKVKDAPTTCSQRTRRGSSSSQDSSSSGSRLVKGNNNPCWEGVVRESDSFHNVRWTCKFCGKKRTGSSTTVRDHLLSDCVPDNGKKSAHKALVKTIQALSSL